MRPTHTLRTGILLGLCLLPAAALAQDGFYGHFETEGRHARRNTSVKLSITNDGGNTTVERVGKFTSRRYRDLPEFTWTAQDVRFRDRAMIVTYRIKVADTPEGFAEGLVANLDPDTATIDDVESIMARTNVFSGVYFLSQDKKTIRELLVNTTRLGGERWYTIQTKGDRQANPPAPGELTDAQLLEKAHGIMRDWYLEDVRDHYDREIAEAENDASLSATERAARLKSLREARAIDEDFSNTEFVDDDYFLENIQYSYENDEPFRDAYGAIIPFEKVKVIALSMYPEYAGIGLSKTWAFDSRTGAVLEEGDVQD